MVVVQRSQYNKDNNMYSSFRQIEYERKRTKEKAELARKNLVHGMILAPVLFLGWFFILWAIIKVFKL